MSVIVTERLTKRYGRRVGIDGLSLSVPEGSLFGFLGPNGSGKTTTIRILLGFLAPGGGSASVFGRDCWRESHIIKADVGYVPGDLRLYPRLTGREALKLFENFRRRDMRTHGLQLAGEFDLDPDLRVRKMSRGMRQKLGLILALAHQPQLLVLDEPTSALDPLMQAKLNGHLRGLASAGHTVFFSSHTLSEVEELCDRVAILRQGSLVADESLAALRARANRTVVLRWQNHGAVDGTRIPTFLEVNERRGLEWHATLTGDVMELVRWSSHQPLADISIGQPDLTAVFQRYYSV